MGFIHPTRFLLAMDERASVLSPFVLKMAPRAAAAGMARWRSLAVAKCCRFDRTYE